MKIISLLAIGCGVYGRIKTVVVNRSSFFGILAVLLMSHFLWIVMYPWFLELSYNSDSVSYYSYPVFMAYTDLYRTPVYPVVIRVFECLFDGGSLRALITFQYALALFSVVLFYLILVKLIKSRLVAIGVSVFFSCNELFVRQVGNVNPELLSIFGVVMLAYFIVRYDSPSGRRWGFLLGAMPFILTMIKPVFVFLYAVLLVHFVYTVWRGGFCRRVGLYFVAGCLSVLLLTGYSFLNYRNHGAFTVSDISMNNQIANCVLSKCYRFSSDSEIVSLIEDTASVNVYLPVFLINNQGADLYRALYERFPAGLGMTPDMAFVSSIPDVENFPRSRIQRFIHESQWNVEYFKYIVGRVWGVIRFFKLNFALILFLAVVSFGLRRTKRLPLPITFCMVFVPMLYLTIALGGIYQWDRVGLPALPLIMLMWGFLLDALYRGRSEIYALLRYKEL